MIRILAQVVFVVALQAHSQAPLFSPAPGSPVPVGEGSGHVVLGDLNGDRFVPAPGSPFRAGPGAYRLALGDVNKDGKLDVAASSFEGNTVTLLFGR